MGNSKTSLVSCLCNTYGRPNFLEEAIKCFLDQDYPNKELIVLNDQVNVNYYVNRHIEADNIRIVNCPKRFDNLGQKRNYSLDLAKGDYICVWDDDDLYTPWRISESVKYMENNDCDIVKANSAIISTHNKDHYISSNLFHSQACIRKSYNKRYLDMSTGEDIEYEKGAKIKSFPVEPLFWYVYRWGNGVHHVSGIQDNKLTWEKSLNWPTYQIQGDLVLNPRFYKDYWKDIEKFLLTKNKEWAKIWYKKIKENT